MRQRASSRDYYHSSRQAGIFRVFSSEDFEKSVQQVKSYANRGPWITRLFSVIFVVFLVRLAYMTLVHSKGELYFRPSDSSVFYVYGGKYWFVPTPTSCANLVLSSATVSTAIRYDVLNMPTIYDMDNFRDHCKPKRMPVEHVPACQGTKCSAVATLYNVLPGGGEKYLLSLVRAIQKMGDFIDILILPGNSCNNKKCVMKTAEELNIAIDWNQAAVRVVDRNSTHFLAGRKYHIFALLGNDKIPKFKGSGNINLYLNQFPFDRQRAINTRDQSILATYQHVVLNSEYTKGWYSTYTNQTFGVMKFKGLNTPQPVVINPPVTLAAKRAVGLQSEGALGAINAHDMLIAERNPWIVMTGRFFDDVQGKHHLDAIEAFRILKKLLTMTAQKALKKGRKGRGQSLRGRGAEPILHAPADLAGGAGAGAGAGVAVRAGASTGADADTDAGATDVHRRRLLDGITGTGAASDKRSLFFDSRSHSSGAGSSGTGDVAAASAWGGDERTVDVNDLQLFLAGYQMPGHEGYTRQVGRAAARVGGVHVLVNIDAEQLVRLQSRTSIVWSLTGGTGVNDNPADAEHFGIAVVEAMGTGNIPILTDRGGLHELVGGNKSHLCSTIQELAKKTSRVLHLPHTEQAKLRTWARKLSDKYGDEEFDARVQDLIYLSGDVDNNR